MQKQLLLERIQELTSPIYPKNFTHITKLNKLANIKCVAFDFYGTMFLSGVGDIGVDEDQKEAYQSIFVEALENAGFRTARASAGAHGLQEFQQTVERHIEQKKGPQNNYPEPDIVAVWNEVLTNLLHNDILKGTLSHQAVIRFAIEYEFGVNNIWPVPKLKELLCNLADERLKLGIISNSQFYTPLAFEALLGKSTKNAGFDPELQKWSYIQGVKKPSLNFYRSFTDELAAKKLAPREILYIGNDLFKDVIPAKKLGMKTGLYVGDKRSVRHKKEDLVAANHQPDIIIDKLHQLVHCIA